MGIVSEMKKVFFSFFIINIILILLIIILNQKLAFEQFLPYQSILGTNLWLKVMLGTYCTQTIFAFVIFWILKKLFSFDAIAENPLLMFIFFCFIGLLWGTIRLNQTVCVSANCKSGIAKVSYLNGNSFEGDVEDNKPHGIGVLTIRDGSIYKGSMFEALPHGSGELTTSEYTVTGGWYKGKKSGQLFFKYRDGRELQLNYKEDKVIEQ